MARAHPLVHERPMRREDYERLIDSEVWAFIRRTDEWYYFDDYDPVSKVLVTLDPASIGESDTNPNPVAWTRQINEGRIFYTAMGHTRESYSDQWFLTHISNGLDWVLKRKRSDGCSLSCCLWEQHRPSPTRWSSDPPGSSTESIRTHTQTGQSSSRAIASQRRARQPRRRPRLA